jgi:hypothetical protein
MRPRALISLILLATVGLSCGRSTLLDSLGAPGGGGAAGATISSSTSAPETCVPRDEVCNGLDDDCDGQVDQGDPGGGAPCETGLLGTCGLGTLRCVDAALSCIAQGEPVAESCNGLDDDCNGVVDDAPICALRVFVTSQLYTGDLGGLAGADARCQALADAAGLGGTHKAWLSSSTVDARDRLTHFGKPYVLVDGSVVASDWDEFASLHHQRPIDVTEAGEAAPISPANGVSIVYTGSSWDGTLYTWPQNFGVIVHATCDDWLSMTAHGTAGAGYLAAWGSWTSTYTPPCWKVASLYCLEQ